MNLYFGWIQGSDMPSVYVHLSGLDIDDAAVIQVKVSKLVGAKITELLGA